MMMIEEAIMYSRYKADENRKLSDKQVFTYNGYTAKAEYFEQVSEWLAELKTYKEYGVINKKSFDKGYDKAIDDFKVECHKQISKNHEKYGFNQRHLVNLDCAEIDMIAEQLKDGGKNEIN